MLNLQYFYGSNNRLTGTLPDNILNCAFLAVLDLSYNMLNGVPATLSGLNLLQQLFLQVRVGVMISI